MDKKALWYSRKINFYSATSISENALKRFQLAKQSILIRRDFFKKVFRYAAIIILLFGIASVLWIANKNSAFRNSEMKIVTVATNGKIQVFDLEDSTRVWLNKGSTFTYPKKFNEKERKVSLEGEAYFDVKHDPNRPFLINTHTGLIVKVLGTSFNVNTHLSENSIATTLVTGNISLENKRGKILAKIEQGTQAIYNKETKNLSIKDVNANEISAWHKDVIFLSNSDMKEITSKIEEIYMVKVHLDTLNLPDNRYNFIIWKGQSIDTVMKMLEYISSISYEINNKDIKVCTK